MLVTTKKVEELAGNARKGMEGSGVNYGRYLKEMETEGKLGEGARSVRKVLATTRKYVARNDVIDPRKESAVRK